MDMKTKCPTKISSHALMLIALLFSGVLPAVAQTSPLYANGKIAFTCFNDGNPEIYVVNADSTNPVRLTKNSVPDDHPVWSPDGTKIAFVSERPGAGFAIFMMNADGTNRTAITTLTSYFSYPAYWDPSFWVDRNVAWSMSWSPDGKRIVFQDSGGLVMVNIIDGNRQELTNGRDLEPSWSPDGSRILFSRYIYPDANHIYGGNILHTIKPDGTDLRELPNGNLTDGWDDSYAKWSPSGDKIAFAVNAWDFGQNIFTANADGTNRKFFDGCNSWLDTNCNRDNPGWSPDGKFIVYSIEGRLFVKSIDGTNSWLLATGRNASWQPVGSTACSYPKPIDCPDFFIRQQYRDFLNREGEAAGLQFYLNILDGCNLNDAECIRYTRGALSANFFRSPEFGRKGAYVANLFNIVFGQRPKTVAELSDASKVERPHYAEFETDLASLSTPTDDPALDDQKKSDLAVAWLARNEVQAILPSSLSSQQFVQKLESVAGVIVTNESTLIANLDNGIHTRAQVLRAVAESNEVVTKFYIQNFVTMEYFGYLRRDPEDCHNPLNWNGSDPNQCGYIFHNNRFNTPGADPDLIENIIVRGFIESPEYRGRFGLP
jgi:Tol biopolymer transport system component